MVGTTTRDIESYLYNSKSTRNISTIKKAIEILKKYNIVDYNIDIEKVKPTEMVEIEIVSYEQYMAVYEEDFAMLKQMGSNFFIMYSFINNYHNKKEGYSYPSYEMMETLLSRATISKHLDSAFALNIYDINTKGSGWNSTKSGQTIRSNNMYTKRTEAVKKVAEMTTDEIQSIIEIPIDTDNRYKADKGKPKKAKNSDAKKSNAPKSKEDRQSIRTDKVAKEPKITQNKDRNKFEGVVDEIDIKRKIRDSADEIFGGGTKK